MGFAFALEDRAFSTSCTMALSFAVGTFPLISFFCFACLGCMFTCTSGTGLVVLWAVSGNVAFESLAF